MSQYIYYVYVSVLVYLYASVSEYTYHASMSQYIVPVYLLCTCQCPSICNVNICQKPSS